MYVFTLIIIHFVCIVQSLSLHNVKTLLKHNNRMQKISTRLSHLNLVPKNTNDKMIISRNWVKCLLGWPQSQILSNVKSQIYSVACFTAFLQVITIIFGIKLTFPFFIHIAVGSALSLLLVFKTNTSYDRFWEGRKLWV